MGLRDLLAAQAVPPAVETSPPRARSAEGLHRYVVELVNEHRSFRVAFSSPEVRISDHLNGSSPILEVEPLGHASIDLLGAHASVNKAGIRFVSPIEEPARPRPSVWQPMQQHGVWLASGPFEMEGLVHLETGVDARVALRLLDDDFLPLTRVTVRNLVGNTTGYDVLFVNRGRIDILGVRS